MTLSATAAVNRYVAAEDQLVFPFTFKLLEVAHLQVFVGATAVTSGFAVSGLGNDTGGNVTFSAADAPRPAGGAAVVVTLRRSVPLDQVVDLPAQGSISSVSLEESGLDRIVMILQQLAEIDERSFKVSVESSLSGSATELAPEASKLLGFNASGTALTTYATSALTGGLVPTGFAEGLLQAANADEALSTLGVGGLNPSAQDAGQVPIVNGIGSFALVEPPSYRNLIRNGAMRVNQRESGSDLGAVSVYTIDGFQLLSGAVGEEGRISWTQDSDVPAGAGFSYALRVECTTAETTAAAGELLALSQNIEALDLQHLLYGTADARTCMISFWVRSPKSGIHCIGFRVPDSGRCFVREYSVIAADTWQKITLELPGDTAGGIDSDNGTGLSIIWPLVAGSDWQTTADQWTAGNDYCTANQQNLMDDVANSFYLTGVQLEVGAIVTAFEHLPISIELARNFRYYYRLFPKATSGTIAHGGAKSANQFHAIVDFPVRMRSAPTYDGALTGSFNIQGQDGGVFDSPGAPPATDLYPYGGALIFTRTGAFTANTWGDVTARGSSSQYFSFSAEL